VRVAYFVHDIADHTVSKRVRMLKTAGAEIAVLGFRRSDRQLADLHGAPVFDLGRTHDARLVQRAFKVVQRRSSLGEGYAAVRNADVLLARNLEMLAVAAAAQRRHAPNAVLVYECLDMHRLLLADSASGRVLRSVERAFMRKARLLIVSSSAFVTQHFALRQGVGSTWDQPVLVVENKLLELDGATAVDESAPTLPAGPPWRIGWFGMIRCRRSLDILRKLVARNPGLAEVVIMGKPAHTEFANFHRQVRETPGITFGGAYAPAELKALYESVHFNWAIDYFEDGANSALLLPNRIYEGSPYGAVPIALAHTETGRWLKDKEIGVLLDSPGDELGAYLKHLTPAANDELRRTLQAQPRSTFVAHHKDCERLMNALSLAGNWEAERHAESPQSGLGAIRSINRV